MTIWKSHIGGQVRLLYIRFGILQQRERLSTSFWRVFGTAAVIFISVGDDADAQSGACQVGARVTDRQNRSGVVTEATGSDCRVKLDDGTMHYYLAWMLSAASSSGAKAPRVQGIAAKALAPGNYHCVAAGGIAGTLKLVIKDATHYADRQGKTGVYAYDPKSGEIAFESGSWEGYFGKNLGPGRIGIASRRGTYYGTTCDLK